MAWYNTGSIALTNGSATVTGSGTNFLVGAQIGEALYAPDGKLYEIQTINSATVITLASNYLGSTATGQSYQIIPTQSLVADLASDVTDLISDFANVRDYAGNGKFNDGAVGTPGITFTQDQDNGLYRIGANNWALAAGGQQVVNLTTTAMNFPDNSKAIFGAGNDLQIYHDGSNSYIDDQGTGGLYIRSSSNMFLTAANGEKYFKGTVNGATTLYYDDAEKLATTATGIDVTGTATMDGLTVDGTVDVNLGSDGSNIASLSGATAGRKLDIQSFAVGASTGAGYSINATSGQGQLDFQTAGNSRLNIHAGGDISFYEDTGTTPKFFWDASAESLGIGTSAPITISSAGPTLEVSGTAGGTLVLTDSNATSGARSKYLLSQGGALYFGDSADNGSSPSNNLVIDASGNVGIGTSLPAQLLNLESATNPAILITDTTNTTSLLLRSQNNTSSVGTSTNHPLVFETNSTEAMRIGADGSISTPTAGISNLRLGSGAGISLASGGSYNTLIGDNAGSNISTADGNTFIGYAVGYDNTTGTNNVAIGGYDGSGAPALRQNETGSQNVAVGNGALGASIAADANTAVGHQAGLLVSSGTQNTLLGAKSGDAISSGSYNTLVGYNAGGAASTGDFNAFFGRSSGSAVTTGGKNTIIGSYNGNQGGLDIRTTSNNIVLADGDGNPRGYYHGGLSSPLWVFEAPSENQYAFQIKHTSSVTNTTYGLLVNYANQAPNDNSRQFISCIDSSDTRFKILSNGNAVNVNNSYGAISDEKLKENIVDSSSQWEDIKALTVRKYSMKADNLDAPNMLGVIAQEVEAAGMGGLVYESPDLDKDMNDLGTVTKQVNYSILYMKAVKALQEAMDRIETLEAKVAALES